MGGSDSVRAMLARATDVQTHRGPDGAGYWVGDGLPVALGQRRLAIIDLSDAASQPMVSADGRRVVNFNGELYNYRELREELRELGHRFTTASDTEVLLTGCAQWGPAGCAARIRGMFAVAYVDLDAKLLWLFRDRFGEKPLYWSVWEGSIAFASELKSLRTLPGLPVEIDRQSVAALLAHDSVSAPNTIYSAVNQVRPGEILRVRLSDEIVASDVTTSVYWDSVAEARASKAAPYQGSLEDAVDRLDELLSKSVAASMVSDVPLGAFLSGGIDSSTVVALMCRHSTGPVKTFTIGFDEAHMSEADEARKVAAHLGVDHTELTVTSQDALDLVPRLADMYDEPFGDSSQLPTHLVSVLARQHVTVSLSGDGGDELFGGYNRYFLAGEMWPKVRRIPRPVRSALSKGIVAISPKALDSIGNRMAFGPLGKLKGGAGERLHKLAGLLGATDASDLHGRLVSRWPQGVVLGAVPPQAVALAAGFSFTEQLMLRDTTSYLPDDILVKVDRAAMATSLETRVPMLDPDVYRFAWSLPLDLKARSGRGKIVLRELLGRYVPPHLFERPKQGFAVPLSSWLRGPLREWGETLLDRRVLESQGLLDADLVRSCWEQHQSGERNWQDRLWDVLMFQAWMERWVN